MPAEHKLKNNMKKDPQKYLFAIVAVGNGLLTPLTAISLEDDEQYIKLQELVGRKPLPSGRIRISKGSLHY